MLFGSDGSAQRVAHLSGHIHSVTGARRGDDGTQDYCCLAMTTLHTARSSSRCCRSRRSNASSSKLCCCHMLDSVFPYVFITPPDLSEGVLY